MRRRQFLSGSTLTVAALVAALTPSIGRAQTGPPKAHIVVLENRASGGVLEVAPESNAQNGTRLRQREFVNGRTCQQWIISPVEGEPDVYRIENRQACGQVLDAEHFTNDRPGTSVQTWTWRACKLPILIRSGASSRFRIRSSRSSTSKADGFSTWMEPGSERRTRPFVFGTITAEPGSSGVC